MDSNRIELFTKLTPLECVARLEAEIDIEHFVLFSLTGLFGSRRVIGRVTEFSFCLRKRIGYRNSFQNLLSGSLRAEAGGTVISGAFGMDLFVKLFMGSWIAFVALVGGITVVVSVGSIFFNTGVPLKNAWVGVVFPLVMLGFGIGLVRLGQYLARDESHFLKSFLMKTLNARERAQIFQGGN